MNTQPKSQIPFDDPEQSKRFEETARQLQADESGKMFEETLKVVAPPGRNAQKKPKPD